ncbi:MAG: hypothetical protein AAF513_05095 [Pseudomonadota bacterium]
MKYTTHGLTLAGLDLIAPLSVTVRPDPEADLFDQSAIDLEFKTLHRILPGRRLSGIAKLSDQDVFAKLFYGKDARRYWVREMEGAQHLATATCASPPLLASGAIDDDGGYYVLYAALLDGRPLDATCDADLRSATISIAQLHTAGFIQSDIHLENFVHSDGMTYIVDADSVRPTQLLREHFANLAMLWAQRPAIFDAAMPELLEAYAQTRGTYVQKMADVKALGGLLVKQRRARVKRYLKKTERECSEFVQAGDWHHHWLCDRGFDQTLQKFKHFPEDLFELGDKLKTGNSATVVRLKLDGRAFVIKRYNVRNPWHRVRRWFKSRARAAWRNGHWLAFMGLPVARPLALLEQRWGPLRGVAYLVMPDCGDRHLGQVLDDQDELFAPLAAQMVHILKRLKAAEIAHGDMKATNFVYALCDTSARLSIIDYDALRYGDQRKDRARFLKNWREDPELAAVWENLLQEAGL